MMTHAMLTGKTREHLVPLGEAHSLQPAALTAFTGLQQGAARDGFQLQPASTYSPPAPFVTLPASATSGIKNSTASARCWIKTASRWWQQRFPWRNAVPLYCAGLQLEPWEYEAGGYFAELNDWLTAHMAQFDFYRPFAHDRGGVAVEP